MIRFWLLLSLLMVGCGLGPQAYPGDKTETRVCYWCNGTGLAADEVEGRTTGGKCPGCRGAKKLKCILPGPNHPAEVRGTVRDATALGDMANNPEAAALMAFEENRRPGPIRGAVSAKISFEGADKIEYTVPASGRIKTLLKPGHYNVTITAPGFQELKTEADVRARQEPIWDERAHLVTPEREADVTYLDFVLKK